MAMADWLDLPEGLMDLIMGRLEPDGPDVVRCQAVCSSWKATAQHVLNTRRRSVPWMLIPDRQDPCARTLLNVHTQQSRSIHLPELHDRWICTAANGWLLTLGLSRPYPIHLLNPVSREEVSLPLRRTFLHPQMDGDDPRMNGEDEKNTYMQGFIKSAALSTTPSDPNCVVLLIYGMRCNLALCKPGDDTWTHVEDPTGIPNFHVMFYNVTRKFYAADNFAHVKELDKKALTRISSPPEVHIQVKYLVESLVSGDLWLVLRNLDETDPDAGIDWDELDFDAIMSYEREHDPDAMFYNTTSFTVFKVDLANPSKEMTRVDCLGEEALFLGHNASISVIVDRPGWCRPNCIYFLDDYLDAFLFSKNGCYDMGVYDLATMHVQKEELASIPVHDVELRSRICQTAFLWMHLN